MDIRHFQTGPTRNKNSSLYWLIEGTLKAIIKDVYLQLGEQGQEAEATEFVF